ncbi:MAG: sulfatase [Tepidisphaeraceae bacterium]
MRFIAAVLITAVFAGGPAPAQTTQSAKPKPMNVLFIAVDDLRPQLGCYGQAQMKTPNLDALAASGLLFNRAYCQQAVCSPSRTSLLTGRRPDTTRVYDLETHFRTTIPDVITLPQHFKNGGYHTQGFGKIYHGSLDDERSWSVPHTPVPGPAYADPKTLAEIKAKREALRDQDLKPRRQNRLIKGPPWESAEVSDDDKLPDGKTASSAIKALREVKDKPFFLAVGFVKPHLPFVAPKKYFDLYPPAEQIALPKDDARPQGAPDIAFTDFGELRGYVGVPKDGPVPEQQARELIRAYYAATSYMDAQVGRLLAELDALGLRDNTIIILWGDHGWHLGEQGQWCKHTNFENATRAAMMIAVPGKVSGVKRGAKTDALVEFVDIYPTLCELAGLSLPAGLEGTSFVSLLADPSRAWKPAAFSQYPRRGNVMGYSMRTDRYRYTEWQGEGGKPVATELYDHQTDPAETTNIAAQADQAEVVKKLAEQLSAGWKSAAPR